MQLSLAAWQRRSEAFLADTSVVGRQVDGDGDKDGDRDGAQGEMLDQELESCSKVLA